MIDANLHTELVGCTINTDHEVSGIWGAFTRLHLWGLDANNAKFHFQFWRNLWRYFRSHFLSYHCRRNVNKIMNGLTLYVPSSPLFQDCVNLSVVTVTLLSFQSRNNERD